MKKIFFIIFITILLFFAFWGANNYLFISIDNRIKSDICLHSAKLGFLKYKDNESIEYRENVTFSDFFGLSNKITVSFSPGACSEKDASPLKTVSCTLDRVGSDSCHLYLYNSGIDCTECYK